MDDFIKELFDSESEYEEYITRQKEEEINRSKEKIKELEIILEYLKDILHREEKSINNKFFSCEEMEKRKNSKSATIARFLKCKVYHCEYRLKYYNEKIKKLKE